MAFKDYLAGDLDVFDNSDEFADTHEIEYSEITCMIDTDVLTERSGADEFGMNENNIRLFAKTSDLEEAGITDVGFGGHLNIDGAEYVVQNWYENMGMTEINLSAFLQN